MRTLATCLLVLAACGGSASSPAPGPKAPPVDTRGSDLLWAEAPASATWGVVLAPGGASLLLGAGARLVKVLEEHPDGKPLIDSINQQNPTQTLDQFVDLADWKAHGWDLDAGSALFLGDSPVLVASVSDATAFKALAARFHLDCGPVAGPGRVRCGLGAPAGPAGAGALLAAARKRKAPDRGQLEVLAAGEIGHVWRARFTGNGLDVTGRIDTHQLSPLIFASLPLDKAIKPKALRDDTKGTAGVVWMNLAFARMFSIPSMPVGGIDARSEIIDQLSGETALISGSKAPPPLAGESRLPLKDAKRVTAALEKVCTGLGQASSMKITWDSGHCTLVMQNGPIAPTGGWTIRVAVEGNDLVFRPEGTPPRSGEPLLELTGSPATRAIVSQPASFIAWGRGWDVAQSMAELVDVLGKTPAFEGFPLASVVELVSWVGVHLYDAGLAVGLDPEAQLITVHLAITTFEADPQAAQDIYARALARRAVGDRVGFQTELEAIARNHPGSLLARQAKLYRDGAPVLGMPIMVGVIAGIAVPAFEKYLERARQAEAPPAP